MKLSNYIFLYFLFISISISAQENVVVPNKTVVKSMAIDEGTINDQFNYIIKKSYSYKDFKNVKLTWLYRLQKAVDDSLHVLETELNETSNLVKTKNDEINDLTISLDERNNTIVQLNKEKDGIKLIGVTISKPLYNTVLWSIIGLLLTLFIIYVIRFNRSNIITKDCKIKIDELESEFDGYRQRSLEREQQLRRKLQDEINKQRKEK